jgi:crotonobetainyl-CoA:carnitine CoA-transferase CaiB-like acyl-CoA transferase
VDGIVQADSGMIEITGHPGGPGVRVGFPVVDHAAGFVLVASVLAALLGRATGTGRQDPADRHHPVVLFDVALSMQASPFTDYLVSGTLPHRIGNASQGHAHVMIFGHGQCIALVAVARHQVQPPYAGVSPHVDPERTLIGAPRIHHAGVNVSQAAPSDGSAGLP